MDMLAKLKEFSKEQKPGNYPLPDNIVDPFKKPSKPIDRSEDSTWNPDAPV
jgi:hypothetical protein